MHKVFDIKGQEGTRLVVPQARTLVYLQMWVCISLCLSFFTCTKEKMILSALEKGFETCRVYRSGMVMPVILNSLCRSQELS